MGLYDSFDLPGTPADGAQVKCFDCEMHTFKAGDEMPWSGDYAIALREGGYAVISDGRLTTWQEEAPTSGPIYDKWGAPFVGDVPNTGLLGEDYFFAQSPKTGTGKGE